jgi:hypothetical protein
VAILTDICLKYGFINPGMTFLHISGHPADGLVTFTYRVSASLSNVKLPALISRTFKIVAEGEEWNTGEILSPQPWGREEIWAQLSSIRSLRRLVDLEPWGIRYHPPESVEGDRNVR